MSKSPITWLELIKEKLTEAKKNGKSASIGEVVPEAKKEWVQIKNGTHPKYTQGKAKTHARKGKKSDKNSKTKKNSASAKSTSSAPNMNINDILNKAKVCKKCRKNIEKAMKKSEMKGGSGGCGCGGPMSGGCATCSPA
jgi:membrane protein involved in colicin uptake